MITQKSRFKAIKTCMTKQWNYKITTYIIENN